MKRVTRQFAGGPAKVESIPLNIGMAGGTFTGKTKSALRGATGIASVCGGKIFLVDTENRRGLHYANEFEYIHVPFDPPFGPLDYIDVINYCASQGASVIIIDSMSPEHEGPGGLLEMQEAELDRMAGDPKATDYWRRRESCQMKSWIRPKGEHRQLRTCISRTGCHIIYCFRAKEVTKPVKGKDGKIEVKSVGFVPIISEDLLYEMTVLNLFYPQAYGVPTWKSDEISEKTYLKLPSQFKGLLDDGKQFSEEHGRKLAEWARGVNPEDALVHLGPIKAALGTEALRNWWEALPISPVKKAVAVNMPAWKALAAQADNEKSEEARRTAGEPTDIDPDTGLREVEISHLSAGIIQHPPRSNPTPEDMREIMSPEPIERKEAPAVAPPPQQQTLGEERL